MHVVSLLFGIWVVAVALGLESHRRHSDRVETGRSPLDVCYRAGRRRGRRWTNLLVAVIGLLATAAGVIGVGPIWMVLWALVPPVLCGIVVLAVGDFWRTNRYLQHKLPELRREILGVDTLET